MLSVSSITVIIPVYCTTQESLVWLDECLASVTKQGCEVVVYDDGSPISTKGIISKYNVVASYGSTNKGVSYARNRAIELAQTDIIIPLDCDDVMVENAVANLLTVYDGVIPVYPDIYKFGLETVAHYPLLEFDCSLLTKYIGFTSVNILHRKAQWEAIGGYDETIDFYEDGEYNARLMGTFCGKRLPFPVIGYRMHESQRTKSYNAVSKQYAVKLLDQVRRYKMACSSCGNKRKTANLGSVQTFSGAQGGVSITIGAVPVNMPTMMNGMQLAQYVGGEGKARHYYNGYVSKKPYKVLFGDYLYADPRDLRDLSNTSNPSLLIKIEPKVETVVAPVQQVVTEPVVQKITRTPVK